MNELARRLGSRAPKTAIILGSSLGPLADAVENPLIIAYGELPGFPVPRISGHAGKLVVGTLGGCEVAVLQGRAHPYVGKVFREGLTAIRDEILARDPSALPGETSNHCYFCWYVLTRGLAGDMPGGGGQVGGWMGLRPNHAGELIQLGVKGA